MNLRDLKPGTKVQACIWCYGSGAYQRRTRASARHRWKAGTVAWAGSIGNTVGACIEFARPDGLGFKREFIALNAIRYKP